MWHKETAPEKRRHVPSFHEATGSAQEAMLGIGQLNLPSKTMLLCFCHCLPDSLFGWHISPQPDSQTQDATKAKGRTMVIPWRLRIMRNWVWSLSEKKESTHQVEKDHNDHRVSIPLLCAGSPTTRPGCPEPHPAWPWMPPGMGHPQPPWRTCSSESRK